MAKVGRPKKEKGLFDEDGYPISQDHESKQQMAIKFKEIVDGNKDAQAFNPNRGMYAGSANPQEFLEFYHRTISRPNKGRPWAYPTAEALQAEVSAYFEFCVPRRIALCVAGLGAWLGVTTTTLNNWKRNRDTMPFYEVVEPAIGFIHAMTEQGAIDGTVPAVPFMFTSKNYHGLKDVQEYAMETRHQLSIAEQDTIIEALPDE